MIRTDQRGQDGPSRVYDGTGLDRGSLLGQRPGLPIDPLDNTADEQSTSKPSFPQASDMHNPSLQANIIERKKVRDHPVDQTRAVMNPLVMSFGASASPRGGQLYARRAAAPAEPEGGARRPRQPRFSPEDLRASNKAVGEKMEILLSLNEHDQATDVMEQAMNPEAEYAPLTFLPAGQISFPQFIVREMADHAGGRVVTEMSKRHAIVYFGIGSMLYVWDYRRSVQA